MTQAIIDKNDYLTINKEGLDFVKIAISTTNMDAKNLDDINRVLQVVHFFHLLLLHLHQLFDLY